MKETKLEYIKRRFRWKVYAAKVALVIYIIHYFLGTALLVKNSMIDIEDGIQLIKSAMA